MWCFIYTNRGIYTLEFCKQNVSSCLDLNTAFTFAEHNLLLLRTCPLTVFTDLAVMKDLDFKKHIDDFTE